MKKTTLSFLGLFITLTQYSLASTTPKIEPVPTRPIRERHLNEQSLVKAKDLESYRLIETTIRDQAGGEIRFIQKNLSEGSFALYLTEEDYRELLSFGVVLDYTFVHVISQSEYERLSHVVDFSQEGMVSEDNYIGGDRGRCAAGTVGAAIGGAIAGAGVGGPAGAAIGAVGGAMVGSATHCK